MPLPFPGQAAQDFLGLGGLLGSGRSAQRQQVDPLDLPGRILPHGVDHPTGHVACAEAHQLAVLQLQGLGRNRGMGPLEAVGHQQRGIEGLQQAEGLGAPLPDVDASAVTLGTLLGDHLAVGLDLQFVCGTVAGRVQPAGDPENGIPEGVRIHPSQGKTGQEEIVGVSLQGMPSGSRLLPVGGGSHDQAVQGLETPTAVHELAGQPVQQLGMGWPRSGASEVAGRAHQPHAEVMLPDAVHHDPGGQRMVGLGQPLGQREAPPGGFGAPIGLFHPVGRQLSVEHRRHPGQHLVPGIGVFAPSQNPSGRGTTSHVEKRPYLGLVLQLLLLVLDLLLDFLGGFGKVLELL